MSPEPAAMRLVTFQAPVDLMERLDVLAKANERSLSAEVRLAIRAYLADSQEQAA